MDPRFSWRLLEALGKAIGLFGLLEPPISTTRAYLQWNLRSRRMFMMKRPKP